MTVRIEKQYYLKCGTCYIIQTNEIYFKCKDGSFTVILFIQQTIITESLTEQNNDILWKNITEYLGKQNEIFG